MKQNLAKLHCLGFSFLVTMLMATSGHASDKGVNGMSGKAGILLSELMQSADLIVIGKVTKMPKIKGEYTIATLEIERIVSAVWNRDEVGHYVEKDAGKRMINVLQKRPLSDPYGPPDGYAIFDVGGRYLCWLRLAPLSENQKKGLGLMSSAFYKIVKGEDGLVLLSNPKELANYEYMKKMMQMLPKPREPYGDLKTKFERNFGTSDVKKIEEVTSCFAQLMVGNAGSSQELQRLAQTDEPIYSQTAAKLLRLQNKLRRFIYVEPEDTENVKQQTPVP